MSREQRALDESAHNEAAQQLQEREAEQEAAAAAQRERQAEKKYICALLRPHSHYHSFATQLAELRSEGWVNITSATLALRYPNQRSCECAIQHPRGTQLQPGQLFWHYFPPDLCAALLTATKREVVHTLGKRATLIGGADLRRIVGFYTLAISSNHTQIKAYARSFTRASWAYKMYAKFVRCLRFDALEVFDAFNLQLHSAVTAGGVVVLDESMWGWQSSSGTVIFIPRKPVDQGVKVQTACLTLTRTGESYCYHMRPDIGVTKLGTEAIVSDVITQMRRVGLNTLVMDCWYFARGLLESYNDIAITVAMGTDDMASLAVVSRSGLRRDQFRMHACGNLISSVFADVADVRVLSSAFTYALHPANAVIARTGMGTASQPAVAEILRATPLLSESGFRTLCTLTSADINSLARRMGIAGGTLSDFSAGECFLTSKSRWECRRYCPAHFEASPARSGQRARRPRCGAAWR